MISGLTIARRVWERLIIRPDDLTAHHFPLSLPSISWSDMWHNICVRRTQKVHSTKQKNCCPRLRSIARSQVALSRSPDLLSTCAPLTHAVDSAHSTEGTAERLSDGFYGNQVESQMTWTLRQLPSIMAKKRAGV